MLIIACLLFGYVTQKIKLTIDSEEAYGKIYEINRIVNGARVGPQYEYKFWFNYQEKKYFGTSTKTLKGSNKIGKIFKVKFSPNDFSNYEIFFNQEYVERYILDKNGNGAVTDTIYVPKKTKHNKA